MSFLARVKRSLRGCRLSWSLGLCLFEEGYCLDLFGMLIALPFLDRWAYDPKDIMDQWRIYLYDWDSIWFWWGESRYVLHLPWEYRFIVHEVRKPDGSWVKAVNSWDAGEPDGRWTAQYPYRYVLKSGEVQDRIATVTVERREWRQKWLQWTRLFRKVRTCIEVRFNDEVGERSGTWKGGCTGCGYDIKPGETPEQTLRRMESERKF